MPNNENNDNIKNKPDIIRNKLINIKTLGNINLDKIKNIENRNRYKKILKTLNTTNKTQKFNYTQSSKKENFLNKKNNIKKNNISKNNNIKKNNISKYNNINNISKNNNIKKYNKKNNIKKYNTNKIISTNKKIVKITEFATVNELSAIINISETEIIKTCLSLGIMVTMNQRLNAETITLVAHEFGYLVEFIGLEYAIQDEKDFETNLKNRSPIVTIMGHVDHGKTSLIDYIRKSNIIVGEVGGITQHIGAYSVDFEGKNITFIDTPGHEAFTAMRARGAQITDIAVIVIAADDKIMPQTKEAISHAQISGVSMIFAINKIDKPMSQPEKIREQLAGMNLLVEEWGGKYQSQEISAKTGIGINKLLEKIIIESEILQLKANPNKLATGTVIEASLDKGRGFLTNVIIQNGTLKKGDYVLAGNYHGKIKVILDERGQSIKEAGPSKPVIILGLNGAPVAGDKFKVFKYEKKAKEIAYKRMQLQREQNIRTQKYLTLDEIGRRIALGNFKEIKIIIKGDKDGSIEAIANSLQKESTDKIMINIIYKNVGAITESDVLLASASNAIIIGFNVRTANNNIINIAYKENIEIRTYSIIYDIINDIKKAIDGLNKNNKNKKEKIIGNAQVQEIFKIPKIGIIAGCIITKGKIVFNSKIRLIREGIVIQSNCDILSLKRFKEDIKEVQKGYECGISLKNYSNIKTGDIIENYDYE
ncbi:MAG: translation initiation factor IF-2 [Candidatus Bostrichicola ureolyticus]|nr:MAG: translation initiation factor IF-2 [Candidatus Bostrichicola ureolyticus]